ncbi:dTDP-4-dehydrorhamnose 3,5-epimerase [Rubrivirga sp. IMCC45206]|uniref:dTDP-4-dehydrorhamnose 3,5-epimerase n=1 Tax=Rubrivirga sp. IMCC45206 TaxID=3391614 RepID=UPI0039902A36
MTVHPTRLPGVLLVEPRVFEDERGYFLERFHADRYAEAGMPGPWVQDNHSRSRRGVVRGLHFQRRCPQGKLVEVVRGAIYDVVLDLRAGSPTFGEWEGVELSDATHRQLWVPPGFAHGFAVVSETADVLYRCTAGYEPGDEGGVRWDDPALGIDWPVAREEAVVSEKDRALPWLASLAASDLPEAPF